VSTTSQKNVDAVAVYEQLCQNYRAIDDFRTKLLGLLPFASAAGVGVLLSGKINTPGDVSPRAFLGAIGIFGCLVTLGLFSYELHGMKKCGWLIRIGGELETEELRTSGPFSTRPRHAAGFIDEPFAASVIYPATLSAWAFLALALTYTVAALVSAIVLFVGAFWLSLRLIRWIEDDIDDGIEYLREPRLFVRPEDQAPAN
jgi:hypothetical protein